MGGAAVVSAVGLLTLVCTWIRRPRIYLKKETKQKHSQGMQMLLATNHPGSGKGLEC